MIKVEKLYKAQCQDCQFYKEEEDMKVALDAVEKHLEEGEDSRPNYSHSVEIAEVYVVSQYF
jgi:hypothetical protein